jgi:hypothetical protein
MEDKKIRSEFFQLGSEACYLIFEIHSPICKLSLPSVYPQAAYRKNK